VRDKKKKTVLEKAPPATAQVIGSGKKRRTSIAIPQALVKPPAGETKDPGARKRRRKGTPQTLKAGHARPKTTTGFPNGEGGEKGQIAVNSSPRASCETGEGKPSTAKY